MASTSQAVKYSQMSFFARHCHVPVLLLWHEMFLFNLCLIAVNTIKWNLCGSHQPGGVGAGILMSHWPFCVQVTSLSHSPSTHITSPSWPVHEYMSIKCCSTQIMGLSLYHIMEFFPLHLVECSGFLIFFYITVILKYHWSWKRLQSDG